MIPLIELRRYVTFDEDTTFRKSRKGKEVEEYHETPRATKGSKLTINEKEELILEDHAITEHQRPEEFPSDMISCKRRPSWARKVIE